MVIIHFQHGAGARMRMVVKAGLNPAVESHKLDALGETSWTSINFPQVGDVLCQGLLALASGKLPEQEAAGRLAGRVEIDLGRIDLGKLK